jgi:hypothetical protein
MLVGPLGGQPSLAQDEISEPTAESASPEATATPGPTDPDQVQNTDAAESADQVQTGSAESGAPVESKEEVTDEVVQEPSIPPPADAEDHPIVAAPQQEEDVRTGAAPADERNLAVLLEDARAEVRNKICNCRFGSDVPYRERRSTIGGFLGVLGGTYAPVNYQPDFVTRTFNDYYAGNKNPNVELFFGLKLNMFLGSLSLQAGGGVFQARNTDNPSATSMLTVYPVHTGLLWAIDNIFPEPYIVPYVMGGVYTAIYEETVAGLSVRGNTALAPFYSGGLMFQLDWLDTETHLSGYEEFGLENTFLFIEARSFMSSSGGTTSSTVHSSPNFSTPIQYNAGLRVEF